MDFSFQGLASVVWVILSFSWKVTCLQLSSFITCFTPLGFWFSDNLSVFCTCCPFQSKLTVFMLKWFSQEPYGPCLKFTRFFSLTPINLFVIISFLSLAPTDITESHYLWSFRRPSVRHTINLSKWPLSY